MKKLASQMLPKGCCVLNMKYGTYVFVHYLPLSQIKNQVRPSKKNPIYTFYTFYLTLRPPKQTLLFYYV